MVVRLAGLALILAACACTATDVFTCQTDDECLDGEQAGLCRPQGYCSFPDGTCDSGHRFGEHAGSFAGDCVSEAGDTEAGSATSTGDGGSGATSTPGATDATTNPADDTSEGMSEVGDGPPDVPLPSSDYGPCDEDCPTCFVQESQSHGVCTEPCSDARPCLPYTDNSGVRHDLYCTTTVSHPDDVCLLFCDERSPCPEGTTCKAFEDPTVGVCVWPL